MDDSAHAPIRAYAEAILRLLPPKEPSGDLASVVARIKTLMSDVDPGPWHLSPILEDDYDSEFVTLAAHEHPHYEEMVAQFFLGNHTIATAELVVLLLNNLEDIVRVLEKAQQS
jgi:hypothetical protein